MPYFVALDVLVVKLYIRLVKRYGINGVRGKKRRRRRKRDERRRPVKLRQIKKRCRTTKGINKKNIVSKVSSYQVLNLLLHTLKILEKKV